MQTKEFRIKTMDCGLVNTNCYFLIDPESREAILIDCEGKAEAFDAVLKKEELTLKAVLLTHAHFDHIGAVDGLKKRYPDVPVYISEIDRPMLGNPAMNGALIFGLGQITASADRTLTDGEKLQLLGTEITCIHTPGHTAGGMCFYLENERILFSGDTLFFYGIGRPDLPTGDEDTLLTSIREKLFVLPEETRVFPGHGPATTIGREKNGNPYF